MRFYSTFLSYRIPRFLRTSLDILGAIVTAFGIIVSVFVSSTEVTAQIAVIGMTIALLLVILWGITSEHGQNSRKKTDAEMQQQSILTLSRKTRDILGIILNKADTDKIQIEQNIISMLDLLTEYYKHSTGKKCRACIKTIHSDDGKKLYLATLARDSNTLEKKKDTDSVNVTERKDSLEGNSDFHFLWNPALQDEGYFFSNDLQSLYQASLNGGIPYNNTSLPKTFDYKNWPLPYKSTIVWPIKLEKYIGFLAVDAQETQSFDKETDITFGQIVATHLSYILYNFTGE